MAKQMRISRNLQAIRKRCGLSQRALATKAGVSLSIVFNIEQGVKIDPKISTAAALAKALGVSLDSLVYGK